MARMVNFSAGRKGLKSAGRYFLAMRPGFVVGALLQLLVFCVWAGTPAFATELNASWEYQLRGGDKEKTQDRFLQRYYLSTGFALEPTDAVTAGANIAYSRFTVTGLGTTETLTPSANLQLSNDIFIAALNGTMSQTRTPTSGTLDIYSWGTSLGSNWQRPFWPTLRFYYDESGQQSDEQSIDNSESSYGSDLTWVLPAASFFYGFNQRQGQDHLNLNQVNSTSHTARLETGGSFFANRLSAKLTETFNTSTTDFKIGAGGEVGVDLQLTTYSAVNSNPSTIDLPEFPLFTPITVSFQEAGHLGVEGIFAVEGEQQVNQLRVSVDEETAIRVETGQVDLQWALYISRDNQLWELLPGQGLVSPLYNSGERRFEIDLPALAAFPAYNFFKVVATNQGNTDVVFTGLRAIQLVSQSQTSEQTTYQTDFNLGYRITSTLLASSTVNLLFAEESTNRNLHGNLRWTPSPYVGMSLGVSENLQQTDARPDQIDRNYTLSVPTQPLPTLSVTSGASRTERFDGSRRTLLTDSFSLSSSALIYPDLKAGVSFGYFTGESEELLGEKLAREGFTGNVNLIARLSARLNASITHNYSQSLLPTESISQESTLNLTYRPSDMLVTRLLATKNWTTDDPTRVDFRLDLALLRTHKTRLNFNYRHLHAETDTDAFGLLGGWDISQIFTLQTQTRYLVDESNSWNLSIKLLMKI